MRSAHRSLFALSVAAALLAAVLASIVPGARVWARPAAYGLPGPRAIISTLPAGGASTVTGTTSVTPAIPGTISGTTTTTSTGTLTLTTSLTTTGAITGTEAITGTTASTPGVITTTLAATVTVTPGNPAPPAGDDGSDMAQSLLTGWVDLESRNSFANALGDLDNDGDLDMVVGTGGQGLRLFVNRGGELVRLPIFDQQVRENVQNVALGDLDRDGRLDLVVAHNSAAADAARVFRNVVTTTGALAFESVDDAFLTPTPDMVGDPTTVEGRGPLALGDLDGDARLDMVLGTTKGLHLYFNRELPVDDGRASFRFEPVDDSQLCGPGDGVPRLADVRISNSTDGFHSSVALADMDGDDDLDLAVAWVQYDDVGNPASRVTLWRNDAGCFRPAGEHLTGVFAIRELAWGDVNGDAWPELAVALRGAPTRVLYNVAGTLTTECTAAFPGCWLAADSADTFSVSWGDADGDGDLDLAVGNRGDAPNQLYINQGGRLSERPVWSDSVTHETYQLKWGDMDNDGDLELVAALYAEPDLYYLNSSGPLAPDSTYDLNPPLYPDILAEDLALGDYDGDGDLDLAVARAYHTGCGFNPVLDAIQNVAAFDCWGAEFNVIYENQRGTLQPEPAWAGDGAAASTAVAWGDANADGMLDLVVGNVDGTIELYINRPEGLPTRASCLAEGLVTLDWLPDAAPLYFAEHGAGAALSSLALADIDQDGFLDLAAGLAPGANRLYRFDPARNCFVRMGWAPDVDADYTYAVAWGDVDNDGDLDLAVGNSADQLVSAEGNQDYIYRNVGGTLETQPSQVVGRRSTPTGELYGFPTRALAWGDMDGDGDLDLATAAWSAQKFVYRNEDGMLQPTPVWTSADSDLSSDIEWVDADNDGDLDLVTANVTLFQGGTRNDLYLNTGGRLSTRAAWQTTSVAQTLSVAWGDIDQDGRTDITFGNHGEPIAVHLGRRGAGADGQGISDLNIALEGEPVQTAAGFTTTLLAPAAYFAVPHVRATPVISIPYRLQNSSGRPFQTVYGRYSPNGARWQVAGSVNAALDAGPCAYAPGEHAFQWQTTQGRGTALFGQSDALRLQLAALPCYVPAPYDVAGSYQRALVTAQSYPFRVRGTQVQVVRPTEDGSDSLAPVADALVFRRNVARDGRAVPIGAASGVPSRTNQQGFLAGYDSLNRADDRLVALAPITETHAYILYALSEAPANIEGVPLKPSVVQQLVVSDSNALYLFNLDISLEWDARSDTTFLGELEHAIVQASDILYDVSEGQVALGEVRIFHGKQNWYGADVVIYASNNQRPRATMGGLVLNALTDPARDDAIYLPGQIRMGPIWDPYGQDRTELSEDWAKALAHELGHYLLFLPDNYLGIDRAAGIVHYVDCPGSIMTHAYEIDYSELLTAEEWDAQEACQRTMAEAITGRGDWETAQAFYPLLQPPTGDRPKQAGPRSMPLALPQIFFVNSSDSAPNTTIDAGARPARFIDLRNGNLQTIEKIEDAQVYLYKTRHPHYNGTPDRQPEDDSIVWMGSTGNGDDRIKVRGAARGDRLCIIVAQMTPQRIGCKYVSDGLTSIEYFAVDPAWQPAIAAASPDGRHITVTVTLPAEFANLKAQLFSAHGPISPHVTSTAPIVVLQQVEQTDDDEREEVTYTATFTLSEPTYAGHVRVWADNRFPFLEAVSQYYFSYDFDPSLAAKTARPGFGPNYKRYGQSYNPYSVFGAGFGPNNPGFGPNNPGFGPNNPGFGPNNPGFGPNNPGFGPNNPGFGPNNPGFGPNNPGFGPNNPGFGPNNPGFGPNNPGFGPNNPGFGPDDARFGVNRAWGANVRALEAPVASGDGRITIFQVPNIQDDPGIAAIISLPTLSGAPPWFTRVGPAYRLINSADDAPSSARSVAFQYLQREVPEGAEHALSIYFSADDGKSWQRLATDHDRDENFAAAPLPAGAHGGAGIYALFTTVEMPELQAGWNVFGYPLVGSQSISDALTSIADAYVTVYAYDVSSGDWSVHHPAAAAAQPAFAPLVNDLRQLDFAQTYWVQVTEPVTPYLPIDITTAQPLTDVAELADPPVLPPATYYGPVDGDELAANDLLLAYVGDELCGTGQVVAWEDGLAYTIHVQTAAENRTCGATGQTVRLATTTRDVATVAWDGAGVHFLPLPADP